MSKLGIYILILCCVQYNILCVKRDIHMIQPVNATGEDTFERDCLKNNKIYCKNYTSGEAKCLDNFLDTNDGINIRHKYANTSEKNIFKQYCLHSKKIYCENSSGEAKCLDNF